MLKFYKKGLALLLIMGTSSFAVALETTFNLDRLPSNWVGNIYGDKVYRPQYYEGKALLSGTSDDVYYQNDVYSQDKRYMVIEKDGEIEITNLPFVSDYKLSFQGQSTSLTKMSLDAFKLVLRSPSGQGLTRVIVTYGNNFNWESFQYSLLTQKTAQVERSANSSEITVPSTLKFAEKGWYDVTVTTVYSNAFANLSKLTKVTLPATINSIGSGAFLNSPKLSAVIVNSVTPPVLAADAFDANAVQNIVVYVPAESYATYKSAPVWKDLNLIPSGDAVAVDGIEYSMYDGIALATAFDGESETVSVPSTLSVDGKDYDVALGLLPGNSYPNLKSIYIGEDVQIQLLSDKNVPNLKKLFYLGTLAPNVTPGAMTSLNGQDVQVYGINEEALAPIVTQTGGTPRVYAMLKNMFTAEGIVYIPTSTAGRTCDAVDYDYSSPAPVLGATASYRNIEFTIKNINPYIFHQAKSIESITVNNSLALPSNFAKETNAATIDLKCADIPAESFINSANLSKLTVNTTVNIGAMAFANSATGLTSRGAVIELNNKGAIESNAFASFGPIDLLHVGNNVTEIKASAFEGAFAGDAEGVVSLALSGMVGDKAFYNAHNIKRLTVGESVTGIGAEAFRYAMTSGDATAALDNAGTIGEDAFRNNSSMVSVTVDDGCSAIAARAFADNGSLKEVTVGNGCMSIADGAFAGDAALETVVLGDGVKTIGNELFKGDAGLKYVSFGAGLTSLGNYVFDNCEAMASLTVKAVVPPTCGTYDFRHIDTWSCELLVPRKSVNAYAEAPQWNEFMNLASYFDPEEVTDIVVDPESGLADLFADGLALYVGDSKEVTVKVVPATAQAELTWSSTDDEIVTVDGGLVVAVGAGEVTVTVSAGDVSRGFKVKVSKREQSIDWKQEFDGLTEGDTVELTATATSGLDVGYKVIVGEASIEGTTLTVAGAGKLTIEASQPGNDEYLAAASVTKEFNAASGVEFVLADRACYRIDGRELSIIAGDFRLFDLRGILVASGHAPSSIVLLTGETYILHINGKRIKLLVR